MRNLSNYIAESKNFYEISNHLDNLFNETGEMTLNECLATFDSDYINEELINEGFWDFMKSIFSSDGRKKYKKAYNDWLEEHEDEKKRKEEAKKLRDEFEKKKNDILEKIKNAKSEEDIEKFSNELYELYGKKVEIETKNEEESVKAEEEAPEDVKNTEAYTGIEDVLANVKTTSQLLKVTTDEEKKKKLVENITNQLKTYSENRYKNASDEVKKEIQDGIKKAKADGYINVSGEEISLKEKEFLEMSQKKDEEENKEQTPDEVAKETEKKTKETIKDNADTLKKLIEATNLEVTTDKLLEGVTAIFQTAAENKNKVRISKTATLGIAIMLMGACMVRKGKAGEKGVNSAALEVIGKHFAEKSKEFDAKKFK